MTVVQRDRFEREVLPHMNALHALALKLTHSESEAEDLVQDTLIKSYNSFDTYEEATNCRAWLFRILTNTFINKYRRQKREDAFIEQAYAEASQDQPLVIPEHELETEEVNGQKGYFFSFPDEIVRAFNSISNEFKSIVVMADLQDFSYKEIAEKLGVPIGTVMSRLFRGRQMLKKSLSDYAEDYGYQC